VTEGVGLATWRDVIAAILAFALTVSLASLSYHWFERPFLRLKRKFSFIPARD
jgi:peptidoglycan/LPS O-acetylase OafA/YrhL